MKVQKTQAWTGKHNDHEVIVIKGEFNEHLLLVNGQSVGYVKARDLREAIERHTSKPRFEGVGLNG